MAKSPGVARSDAQRHAEPHPSTADLCESSRSTDKDDDDDDGDDDDDDDDDSYFFFFASCFADDEDGSPSSRA